MFSFFQRDKRTPYEKARDQTREISSQIRREKTQLNRQIAQNDREIDRLTGDIRKHAMNNNKDALRTLAKAIVKLKHNKSNLYSAIANLDTIDNVVKSQLTNVRLTGVMQKSAEIAQSMAALMQVEQLQGVSQQFSQELMKMGVLDEMMTEAVDSAMDNPDLEDEADEEVQRVLEDVLGEKIRGIPSVAPVEATPVSVVEQDNGEFEQRLQQLKASTE